MTRSLFKRIAIVVVALSGLLGCSSVSQKQELEERQKAAMAMFQDRCKNAGEFVQRTVDNVEGIFLMKVRPEGINFDDQFSMSDPYGLDSRGEAYIKTFFSGFYEYSRVSRPGYRYVEAIDPNDGKRYRYTGSVRNVTHTSSPSIGGDGKTFQVKEFALDRTLATGEPPRYGVTYRDISTREEREHWIAGSSLQIVDLKTNEVIAERIGYMVDSGQGNRSGGRSPWLLAAYNACPAFPADPGKHPVQADQTRVFVTKILRP